MKKLTVFPTPEIDVLEEIYVTLALTLEKTSVTNDKGQIKLANAISQAKDLLEDLEDQELAQALSDQLDQIDQESHSLVDHTGGLVVFVTKDEIYYYHTESQPKSIVDVGYYPNFKPLIENFQFTQSFHLLVLSRESFSLYAVSEFEAVQIPIEDEDAPTSLEQALGTEKEGGELSHGSFGSRGTGAEQTFHGHNDTSNEKDIDRENYFRQVDDYVYENYSLAEGKKLVLYALPENQAVFRDISDNQHLISKGIESSGTNLSDQEIQQQAIAFQKELVTSQKQSLLEDFRETTPEYRIDNHLDDLSSSAAQGRINQLIIANDYQQSGSINDQGLYEESDRNFLKYISSKVIQTDGDVYVLDDEELPEDINISARLRY